MEDYLRERFVPYVRDALRDSGLEAVAMFRFAETVAAARDSDGNVYVYFSGYDWETTEAGEKHECTSRSFNALGIHHLRVAEKHCPELDPNEVFEQVREWLHGDSDWFDRPREEPYNV